MFIFVGVDDNDDDDDDYDDDDDNDDDDDDISKTLLRGQNNISVVTQILKPIC